MANQTVENNTCNTCINPLPENFWGGVILSFGVAIGIGLVIGSVILTLLTCLSRRRASASISPRMTSSSSRRPRTSSHNHALNRSGFYRNSTCERRSNLSLASLTFQRQNSQEQDPFTRKPSFRASTFHPFMQCPPLSVEPDSQLVTLPRTNNVSPTINSLSPPDFHWSNNSLRLGHSTPTPPPAYDSIIKAFPDS
ncbi:myc target protein 1 [Bombina bombina]|uniref:myc target protein 1 n=1 Tax=Bombina bombina TaxID=8345 RepID=UPI00235A9382|nr:myc target protein 1 [Bombina bombina]